MTSFTHISSMMALALHPFVIGQPFRHKDLVKALEYIASHQDVWLTTSDEIAARYLADPSLAVAAE
jgi:hypothetical protein